MKTNFTIYLAAVALVKAGAGTLTVEGLTKECDKQQGVVAKAMEAFTNATEGSARTAAELVVKNETDTLNEFMTALDILSGETAKADRVVEANKAKIRDWGYLTHKTVETGSIAGCMIANKKSWFSRTF